MSTVSALQVTRGCDQIQRTTGLWYSAEYSTFSISDEVNNYQLTVSGYNGDAGDAIVANEYGVYRSIGRMFSTPDRDNDAWATNNCATGSGWWYRKCSASVITKDQKGAWATVGAPPPEDVQTARMLVKLE